MRPHDGSGQQISEMILRDGRILRLTGPRLALLKPDGRFESSHMLSEIADCSNPEDTREVFLRLWSNDELTLLASSIADASRIVQWAANAPRLQRRATNQRAERVGQARIRLIGGGVTLVIGIVLLILMDVFNSPSSYFLLPLGVLAFGGFSFVAGIVQYYRA